MLGDLRSLHLVSMFGLVLTGVYLLDFSLNLFQILSDLAKPQGVLSALITCTSIVLLFRSQYWYALPLALVISLASKGWFQFKGKHFFNPACFGILASYYLLPGNWISPGQWGTNLFVLSLLFVLGLLLVKRVNRMDISLFFLGSYIFCIFAYHSWLGWEIQVSLKKIFSGPILLFAFFMISDPRTSPVHIKGRFIQALLCAVFTFIFSEFFFLSEALLLALFLNNLLTPLWDTLFPQKSFEWETIYDKKVHRDTAPTFSF
jgi:Na+-transporting NADH:ubiquinone oxidoreductase subunit NqrB